MAVFAAVVIAAAAVALRVAFIRQASVSRVDHYYWSQMAASYRASARLPALLPDKYLLEPVEQAYPPFFGWLLGKLPPRSLDGPLPVWLTQAADGLVCLGLVALALCLGASVWSAPLIVALVGAAPVMVSYNVQINPRSFGNLFLAVKCIAEMLACMLPMQSAWPLWLLAVAAAAAVWLTHKMTTQLMLVLWLPWAWSLGAGLAWFTPLLGLLLAALVVGPGFLALQLASHVDILRFWRRHWPRLGVHAVRASLLYGSESAMAGAFHRGGWRGAVQHARLVIGYAPAVPLLPLAWLLLPSPPAWLLVWALGSLAWAMLTLLLPACKTFGGGHLYIFNAAPPAALWFGLALDPAQPVSIILPLLGLLLSVLALALGWRQRAAQRAVVDAGLDSLQQRLRSLPPSRVAVLPLVAAEAVASGTRHAVLWGGHGYGFDLVEPLFPVLSKPVETMLVRYEIAWVAWRVDYWPALEQILAKQGIIATPESFGDWRLARVIATPPPAPRRIAVIGKAELALDAACDLLPLPPCPANPFGLLRWAAALRRVAPDIVYVTSVTGALPALLAVLLAGRPRAYLHLDRATVWLAAAVPSLCPVVVCCSEAELALARACGIAPERVVSQPVTAAALIAAQRKYPA